jgi:hypothetical protein
MIERIIYACMLILVIACNSKKSPDSMQNNNSNFQFNKKVTLTGTYVKSTLSKRGEGEHPGHYKIIVNDSMEVILLPPYLKEAVRPKEEVQRFEGKKVIVTGIIVENTAFSEPSLEDQPLTVNIPCFITIESIGLAKE